MLLILGASTRAAAFSALRAGFEPVAADLFADRDLRSAAAVERVAAGDYPRALAAAAERAPAGPWIYTGSLENHPSLVARIARHRPLWGNDAPILRAVRDPLAVAEALHRAGLPAPAVRSDPRGLKRDRSWLVKPLASGGGRGIVPLEHDHDQEVAAAHPCYYQQRIPGPSFAAVFVASQPPSTTTLVGITRQVVGRPGLPFAYAGSIGPWPLAQGVRERIERVGRTLAAAFGLVGLFGVDLILRNGTPWPVEVNPRYTASVEVLELGLGRALLAEHARACDPAAVVSPIVPRPLPRPWVVGKLVVFAPTRCYFPGAPEPAPASDDPFTLRTIADVPDQGANFEPGEPVLTVFAEGSTIDDCRLRLRRRRAYWLRRLRVSS
jgi:predicted ATP-grasp superfamily ATP-dependent carboligase